MHEYDNVNVPSFMARENKTQEEKRLEDKRKKKNDDLKRKSMNGKGGKRNPHRKAVINRRELVKVLRRMYISGALTAAGIITLGKPTLNKVQDRIVVNNMTLDFQGEIINPNTHRTTDEQHYWYDYAKIEDEMEKYSDDYAEMVYLCKNNIGEYQTSKVVKYSKYGDYDKFLKENGYTSTKDFNEKMFKEISIEDDISKEQSKLEKLTKDKDKEQEITFIGGRSLR